MTLGNDEPADTGSADERINPDSFAELNVATEVFAEPGDAGSTWTRLERNALVYVIETEPGDAGWYHIQFALFGERAAEYVFGWIETKREGSAVLRPADLTPCPDTDPDITWIAGMSPQERLQCFEDETLVFEGTLVSRESPGISYDGEPNWLADEATVQLVGIVGEAVEGGRIEIHFSPGVDFANLVGQPVELSGHFDDPAASECSRRANIESVPHQTAIEAQLWCRQQFVVDGVETAQ